MRTRPAGPTLVASFSEYTRRFGRSVPGSYLGHGVEGFFQNGGKRCFIARVVSGGAAAASRADANLQVDAIGKGVWGNRVAIKIEPFARPDGTQRFRLTVIYWPAPPPTPIVDPTDRSPSVMRDPNRREPQIVEAFDDLSDNPNDSHFYERQINNRSVLITVRQIAAGIPAQVKPPDLLQGGNDGAALVPQDFVGDPNDPPGQKHGLDSFNEIDDISILCAPDEFGPGEANRYLAPGTDYTA